MRRLAFLAAASLAFVAIPEPISAYHGEYKECMDKCSGMTRCIKKCKKILPNGKVGKQPVGSKGCGKAQAKGVTRKKINKLEMYPIRGK